MHVRCPNCYSPIELSEELSLSEIVCPSCRSTFSLIDTDESTVTSQSREIGRFTLLQQVGLGTFGSVWKAKDRELDRFVAIKIPRRKWLDAIESNRFIREAQAAAQLRHPHIVSVHEVGRADGEIYIVSDFVRGQTLADFLSVRRLSARESALLLEKVADALHHAHEHGVVHRDLKPSNILMDEDSQPYLTDFGLARREMEDVTVTLDGTVLGTPAYMSPEQARGDTAQVDRRTDIYSFGVILFRLLTGEPPFRGNPRMLAMQILHEAPPSPRRLNSSIPRDLDTICLKCLEKDPAQRYQKAYELQADLRRFLDNKPIQARPIGPLKQAVRWCQRNAALAASVAAFTSLLLVAVIALGLLAYQRNSLAQKLKVTLAEVLLSNVRLLQQTRPEGYGDDVRMQLDQVKESVAEAMDRRRIGQEVVGTLGDFVALQPVELNELPADVQAIAWHPDGIHLAIALSNQTICLGDARTGEWRPIYQGSGGGNLLGLGFDSKRGTLYVAHDQEGGGIRLLEPREAAEWEVVDSFVPSTAYSRVKFGYSGALVAWNADNISIWDPQQLKELDFIDYEELNEGEQIPVGAIRNVALDPQQELLVIEYEDLGADRWENGFVVWDVKKRQRVWQETLNFGAFAPQGTVFSRHGDLLAIGCDQAFLLYELPTFRRRFSICCDSIKALDFSQDGQFLAKADIGGSVNVWAVNTGLEVADLTHRIPRQSKSRFVRFSLEGTYLADSNASGIKIWSFKGCPERTVWKCHDAHVPTIAYDERHARVLTGSKDEKVIGWDTANGHQQFEIEADGAVQSIQFNPSQTRFAVADWGGHNRDIRIYEAKTGEIVARASHELGFVCRVTFIDDSFLAASGWYGMAIWDLTAADESEDGLISYTPVKNYEGYRCLDIAADRSGTWLAWSDELEADNSPRIRVWNWKQDETPKYLNGPPMLQGWHGLAIAPDSQTLFYVSDLGNIVRWNIQEDSLEDTIGSPNSFQRPHIALSPDGRLIAGLRKQDVASVWDTRTREQLFMFRPEGSAIWSLEWSADSTRLYLGLTGGGLVCWDLKQVNKKLHENGVGFDGGYAFEK